MSGDPQISVVVPSYQRAGTVARAVRSVLNQRDVRVQVIVVDDGSTDGTDEVLAQIDDPRLVVVLQSNRGRGAARNQGAARAVAPVLSFLDSDDELLPGALAHLVGLCEQPRVALARVGALVQPGPPAIAGAASAPPIGAARVRLPAVVDPRRPFIQGVSLAGTYAVRSEVFAKVGGFDPDLGFAENTEFLARVVLEIRRAGWRSRSSAFMGVLVHAGDEAERRAGYGSAQRVAAEVLLERYRRELRSEPGLRSNYWAIVGTDARRAGHRREARVAFARSWLARPTSPMAVARLLAALVPHLSERLPGFVQATVARREASAVRDHSRPEFTQGAPRGQTRTTPPCGDLSPPR